MLVMQYQGELALQGRLLSYTQCSVRHLSLATMFSRVRSSLSVCHSRAASPETADRTSTARCVRLDATVIRSANSNGESLIQLTRLPDAVSCLFAVWLVLLARSKPPAGRRAVSSVRPAAFPRCRASPRASSGAITMLLCDCVFSTNFFTP